MEIKNIVYDNCYFFFNGEYVIEGTKPSNQCFFYKPRIVKHEGNLLLWKKHELPYNSIARSCHSVAFYDSFIYLIGGYDGNRSLSSVERFDFLTKKWEHMQPMLDRRTSLNTITIIDKDPSIYVIGGIKNSHLMNSVDMYNIRLNQWTRHGELIYGRSGCQSFLLQNREDILILGGMGSSVILQIEIYNIKSKKSRLLENVLYGSCSFAACMKIVDNQHHIYLSGGFTSDHRQPTNSVFLFILEENHLIKLPDMNYKRMYHSMTIVDENLYVFGGYDGNTIVSIGEVYDGHQWQNLNFLSHPYCASSFLKIDGSTTFTMLDKEDQLIEIKTHVKSLDESDEILVSKGQLSSEGNRHGLFFYNYNDTMRLNSFFYDQNVLSSYDDHLRKKKLEELYDNETLPLKFVCPITRSPYLHPVVISSGHTYERDYIEQWFQTQKEQATDPMTREPVKRNVYPNRYLKQEINDFLISKQKDEDTICNA